MAAEEQTTPPRQLALTHFRGHPWTFSKKKIACWIFVAPLECSGDLCLESIWSLDHIIIRNSTLDSANTKQFFFQNFGSKFGCFFIVALQKKQSMVILTLPHYQTWQIWKSHRQRRRWKLLSSAECNKWTQYRVIPQ